MPAYSSGLNSSVTKPGLDFVFFQKFDEKPGPQIADAKTTDIFKSSTAKSAVVVTEVARPVQEWEETAEREEYKGDVPRVANSITFTVAKFTRKIYITEEMIDDDQYDTVRQMVESLGTKAKVKQNNRAMQIFRKAATTTLTADGYALLSASHTNLNGDTIDNTISGALSGTSANDRIEEGIKLLGEQKDQAGDIIGSEPKSLLVPMALFREAVEVTESEFSAYTTDNQKNWISSKYGFRVYQSPYIGTAAGGKDDHFFMLSSNHSCYRWTRKPITTSLIPPENQENGDTVYRGKYREVSGVISYEGIVGWEGA